MESNNSKLMEGVTSENGFNAKNLSPMFLEEHIDEMIENVKESLVIYKDLNAIPFNDMACAIEDVLAVIRSDKFDEERAKKYFKDKLNFSEQTVSFLLNMSLFKLPSFMIAGNEWRYKFYQEALDSLTTLAEKLKMYKSGER